MLLYPFELEGSPLLLGEEVAPKDPFGSCDADADADADIDIDGDTAWAATELEREWDWDCNCECECERDALFVVVPGACCCCCACCWHWAKVLASELADRAMLILGGPPCCWEGEYPATDTMLLCYAMVSLLSRCSVHGDAAIAATGGDDDDDDDQDDDDGDAAGGYSIPLRPRTWNAALDGSG